MLLVDDDAESRSLYAEVFRSSGFEVREAKDGLEGLEMATADHPDVIFTGIIMPRMDGFQFLEAVRKDPALKQTVVFVLTTSSRDADRTRAYNENVAGFMVKSAVGPQFSLLANFLDKYAASVRLP